MKKIIIIFNILFLLFFLLAPKTSQAKTCSEKYPGDGYCQEKCSDGDFTDSGAELCSASKEKCCHNDVAATPIILQVPILQYSEATNATEYIAKIYEASLYIIIPFIIVIIIFAGVLWAMARGDNSLIQKAKSRILYGFIGLGIALFSYVLLSIVGITGLSSLKATYIQPSSEEYGFLEFQKDVNYTTGSAGANYPNIGGQCFPVAGNSFRKVSWNWGNSRSKGGRCHAGIDIYTKKPGHAIAIADGIITGISKNFYTCKSGWSGAGTVGKIMINHGNYTVNYAEIDVNKFAAGMKVGSRVTAGQFLGIAGHCGMLHFELYNGKVSNSQRWYPTKGKRVGGSANYCRSNYLATKPASLLDPTKTLQNLQSHMCGQ